MRKRILIFLLAALFVLSGCSRQVVSVLSDNGETASEIISQSISSDASSDSSEASSYGSSSLPISSRAAKSTASSKASASVSSNGSGIVAAPTVAEEKTPRFQLQKLKQQRLQLRRFKPHTPQLPNRPITVMLGSTPSKKHYTTD